MSKKRKKSTFKLIALVLVLAIILSGLLYIFYSAVKDDPLVQFVGRVLNSKDGAESIRSKRTDSDKPYNITNNQRYYNDIVSENSVNVMIIGPDEAGGNYDTLMIISLDDENNTAKIINLPRDIYIDYSDKFKDDLKQAWSSYASSKGIYKINAAHILGKRVKYKNEEGRFKNSEYDFTADLIEEVFNIYIDDIVLIKPSSFRKIVDYFGGVEIDVPYRMRYSDPTQDLEIDIEKGLQTLNGKDAEGFVRYRQGIDEKGKYKGIGDIERKNNQVTFVKAFIKQHLNLKNLGKIIVTFNDLNSYIDSSITPKLAGEYGKIAEKLYSNKFIMESVSLECSDLNIKGIYYLELRQK